MKIYKHWSHVHSNIHTII